MPEHRAARIAASPRSRLWAKIGSHLAGWLLAALVPLGAGEAGSPAERQETVLELKDAVIVLNENSRFRINLLAAHLPSEPITLPIPVQAFKALTNASQEAIADLLDRASNYTASVSGGVFTLLPRGNASNALSYVLPRFSIEPTNLFAALHALCRAVPFPLEIWSPVLATREIAPDLTSGRRYPHWKADGFPIVGLSATNASVWGVLNRLVKPSVKS